MKVGVEVAEATRTMATPELGPSQRDSMGMSFTQLLIALQELKIAAVIRHLLRLCNAACCKFDISERVKCECLAWDIFGIDSCNDLGCVRNCNSV